MKLAWGVEIAGTGLGIPDRVVTNDDLAQRLDTSDDWIVQRTGIRERRLGRPDETTLPLATKASWAALADAGLTPQDIDLIICGTITPEHQLPATACELQAALGCRWVPAFDIAAACCGFVWSMTTAAQYIHTGMADRALVVGAEYLTSITDMEERSMAILFGDGAGAAILRRSDDPQRGVLAARMGADGARGRLIWVPAGGAAEPATTRTVNERLHYMRMSGREVYKFAVTQMHEIIQETASEAGVTVADIALVVPHQSNLRIIESACKRAGVPPERVVVNIDRYGNTSAASVAIALHEARQAGRIRPGQLLMLVAFGAGLTWGSLLMRV
ncbi:MAG: ketoacyl-ACP synthase III [Planctomycetes bacterium]|nr:ketoacyl-ACP synthase III [Planctomycetota bacterium]